MTNSAKNIYLDYAATTPVDSRVLKAMQPYFDEKFGNPASIHWAGIKADQAVEEARELLAHSIQANPEEIIFTSSATESNNLALKGVALANKSKKNKILISPIEHECVLNSAHWLETQGYRVELIPVNHHGLIDLVQLEKMLDEQVLLVSVIYASNEIGTIQPIKEIGQLCQKVGAIFHTDAAQAFGKLSIDVNRSHIDLLTTSSHKIYGPKGVAFLFKKNGIKISPLLHGGGQERGFRPSTLNVVGIVGFAKAAEIAFSDLAQESKKIKKLRDQLISKILSTIPHSYLNGHPKLRLFNNINFRFDFVEGESLVLGLDQHGIAASTGSACSSPKLEPSHVLTALGLTPVQAHGSLRLTLGRFTKPQEIEQVAEILPQVVSNLRAISPFKS
jgi:cysteine desulfurase